MGGGAGVLALFAEGQDEEFGGAVSGEVDVGEAGFG
jgi:hypothetical protein